MKSANHFRNGDRVLIAREGATPVHGLVVLASSNGKSLVVAYRPRDDDPGLMTVPVLRKNRKFFTLIGEMPLTIEHAAKNPV